MEMLLPTTANAQTIWLVLKAYGTGLEKLQVESNEQCKDMGQKFKTSTPMGGGRGYACLIGK